MDNLNVIEILKVGLPGLVFLLSFFSFKLLTREQVKNNPSQIMLRSIKHFMHINISLAILTAGTPFLEKYVLDAKGHEPNVLAAHEISELIREALENDETSGPYEYELLNIIKNQAPDSSFSKKLVELATKQEGAFKIKAIPVTLKQDNVDEANVFVCENSLFAGKNIQLFTSIELLPQYPLFAIGKYECMDHQRDTLFVNKKQFDALQNKEVRAKLKLYLSKL